MECENKARIRVWKEVKVRHWMMGGKLRQRFPLKKDLERWMELQTVKALDKFKAKQSKEIPKSTNIFVLGVPRSGTSMVTHVIKQAGAIWKSKSLEGLRMEKKKHKNPKGFWELDRVYRANWRYLHLKGIYGKNYFASPRFSIGVSELKALTKETSDILQTLQKSTPKGRCWVIKNLRMEMSSEIWRDIETNLGCKMALVVAIRSPVEVSDSTWDYWKSILFWKHCMLKILEVGSENGYSIILVSHRHLLTDTQAEVKRLFKGLKELGALGLDGSLVTCVHPTLWRCRFESCNLEDLPNHFPHGVRSLWSGLVSLHRAGPIALTPTNVKEFMGRVDDRHTDGYIEDMKRLSRAVEKQNRQKAIRRVRKYLVGLGNTAVCIICQYMER
ncbi:hypothetical protein AAMO2058_001371100 [Amorphochlora amoebiformis]|mmetsp:Transcript_880/g.1226  ORF Transcript_880/g.1226 Transcript_880/m.1226 type:complete len:387 (-) Transcript_880:315-1475(-)